MISGSTTEAASLLSVSQPAVTRLIQNLESQIDFQLFIRQNGRLHPTPEAEVLFQEVEQAYTGLYNLSNVMRNVGLLASRHLRIVVSTPMAQSLLPDALAQFQQQRPDVRISIRTVVKRDMSKLLDTQQFDVALATFPVDYPPAHLRNLVSLNGVCIMPADHELTKAEIIYTEDLVGLPFISIVPDTLLRMKVDQVFDQTGTQRRTMIEAQSGASICSLVAVGLGVSIVDPFTARGFIGKSLIMKPFRPIINFDFGILLPIQRPRSCIVDEFIEVVRERAREFEKECREL